MARLHLLALIAATSCNFAHGSEPELVGSIQFRDKVQQALRLLQTRDPGAYATVSAYVGRIQEGERSGMWAYWTPPTFEVSNDTISSSTTWAAAAIAHDSFHSKLYNDYRKVHNGSVPDAVWTGKAAEQQCMEHQLAVMKRIGSPQWEIDYAMKQMDGHYVEDRETWNDYLQRRW